MTMQPIRDLPNLFNQSIQPFSAHLPILPIYTANLISPSRFSRSQRLIQIPPEASHTPSTATRFPATLCLAVEIGRIGRRLSLRMNHTRFKLI